MPTKTMNDCSTWMDWWLPIDPNGAKISSCMSVDLIGPVTITHCGKTRVVLGNWTELDKLENTKKYVIDFKNQGN